MAEAPEKASRPLDDVMIAMDVVDTLRHDKRIVDREINDETRRKELIEQLREIYRGQGIDVPDAILEEGVKALEEKRFVYSPPEDSLQVKLARLYVSRNRWGKPAAGMAAGTALAWGGYYVAYERPRAVEQAEIRRELESGIPQRIDTLGEEIGRIAKKPAVVELARRTAETGKAAAKSGDRAAARAGVGQLEDMVAELRRAFEIRIINRKGEVTGLWRVPRVNPTSRNYYLVVEAVGADGKVVPRRILNEETGQSDTVEKWAVRVPKSVFDEIQRDKLDDGIIQKAVIGVKRQGEIEPEWRLEVSGGQLTKW